MNKPEFDQFAENYNKVLAQSMPAGLAEDRYFAEYKIQIIADRLKGRPVKRILDYGCGAGRSLVFLEAFFPDAEIWGFDVSGDSLKEASIASPDANLHSDWNAIEEGHFDLILMANVMHHIPVDQRANTMAACKKSLGEDGVMFVFEHNPYNPLTRYVFERCPFDVDAEMLSLRTMIQLAQDSNLRIKRSAYTLFFPKPLKFLRPAERALQKLPLGAQYYVQLAR